MFEVILSPEVRNFFAAADPPLARKLARCFVQLEGDPRRRGNIKRLTGKLAGLLRYRVGKEKALPAVAAANGPTPKIHMISTTASHARIRPSPTRPDNIVKVTGTFSRFLKTCQLPRSAQRPTQMSVARR